MTIKEKRSMCKRQGKVYDVKTKRCRESKVKSKGASKSPANKRSKSLTVAQKRSMCKRQGKVYDVKTKKCRESKVKSKSPVKRRSKSPVKRRSKSPVKRRSKNKMTNNPKNILVKKLNAPITSQYFSEIYDGLMPTGKGKLFNNISQYLFSGDISKWTNIDTYLKNIKGDSLPMGYDKDLMFDLAKMANIYKKTLSKMKLTERVEDIASLYKKHELFRPFTQIEKKWLKESGVPEDVIKDSFNTKPYTYTEDIIQMY